MTARVHRWISRSEWSAAEPIASAHVIVAIDPGACGAVVAIERASDLVISCGTWDRPEQATDAAWRAGTLVTEINRPIVLIEEPVFAHSGLAAIQQGWDAAWIAGLVARTVGAGAVVRVFASTWQAAVLGPDVDRVLGADGRSKRLPGGEARRARKAAALAQLPPSLAESVKSKARREALADAYGLARWGLLLDAGGGEERAA